jgi:hypothetical protein
MKEAVGSYDVMIFSLTSVTKPFIEPIIEGAPSVQIPTHWFHSRPQDSNERVTPKETRVPIATVTRGRRRFSWT